LVGLSAGDGKARFAKGHRPLLGRAVLRIASAAWPLDWGHTSSKKKRARSAVLSSFLGSA